MGGGGSFSSTSHRIRNCCCSLFEGLPIGQHPIVTRVMNDVLLIALGHPNPDMVATRDVSNVVNYLIHSKDNETLCMSVKRLSHLSLIHI